MSSYTEYHFLDLVMTKEATDVWVHRWKTHWDAFVEPPSPDTSHRGMVVAVNGSDRMPYSAFPSATDIHDRRDVCVMVYHLAASVALQFEFYTNLAGNSTFRVWFTVPISKLVPDRAARIVCDALAELNVAHAD